MTQFPQKQETQKKRNFSFDYKRIRLRVEESTGSQMSTKSSSFYFLSWFGLVSFVCFFGFGVGDPRERSGYL